MGIVNVTPDSFSDGGRFDSADTAVEHGLRLAADGADLVDVGGESTRPGAERPDPDTERERVLPVISRLVRSGVTVSVDTMRAAIAEAALDAGAALVNDVSGGLADPAMLPLIAQSDCPYVCMHWRAHSATMQDRDLTRYDAPGGVAAAVSTELAARIDAVAAAGVDMARVAIDPGIGFSKTGPQNWDLLAGLDRLFELGRPVLLGASRKAFLGTLLAGDDGRPRPAVERDAASAAVATLAAQAGVWAIRTHDVRPVADAVRVAAAWGSRGGSPAGGDDS